MSSGKFRVLSRVYCSLVYDVYAWFTLKRGHGRGKGWLGFACVIYVLRLA